MEIVSITIGLWLALVGVFVGATAFSVYRRRRQAKRQPAGSHATAFMRRSSADQPVPGSLFSEVDTLRLQVETLRSQVSPIGAAPSGERARLRRYRSGQYTELPRTLRRQVRAVRTSATPSASKKRHLSS